MHPAPRPHADSAPANAAHEEVRGAQKAETEAFVVRKRKLQVTASGFLDTAIAAVDKDIRGPRLVLI